MQRVELLNAVYDSNVWKDWRATILLVCLRLAASLCLFCWQGWMPQQHVGGMLVTLLLQHALCKSRVQFATQACVWLVAGV